MRYFVVAVVAVAVYFLAGPSSFALDLTGQSCAVIGGNCAEITGDKGLNTTGGNAPVVVNVINVALGILGGLAVVMLIVGALRYVLSQGDSGKIAQAKSTIIYSVVGIVLAIFSYAIVAYIADNIA